MKCSTLSTRQTLHLSSISQLLSACQKLTALIMPPLPTIPSASPLAKANISHTTFLLPSSQTFWKHCLSPQPAFPQLPRGLLSVSDWPLSHNSTKIAVIPKSNSHPASSCNGYFFTPQITWFHNRIWNTVDCFLLETLFTCAREFSAYIVHLFIYLGPCYLHYWFL